MAADDPEPAGLPDLVALMYGADWTTLSLAAEIEVFDDYAARQRMLEPPRPPWAPRPRVGHRSGPGRPAARSDRGPAGPNPESDQQDFGPDETPLLVTKATMRLLLAPGGRFREETRSDRGDLGVRGFDGRLTWCAGGDEDYDREADEEDADRDWSPSVSPALPPCAELMCPAWLPARFRLELAGSTVVSGRRARRILGTPRPVGGRRTRPGRSKAPQPGHRSQFERIDRVERIDALVDAELGILLRCEHIYRGQVVSRREIMTITLDPPGAADQEHFAAPDGAAAPDSHLPFSGPGWERAKTATNVGASAMSFAIRHAPDREPPAGSRPGPADTPATGGGEWQGRPGPDEPLSANILRLLYDAGLRGSVFKAELQTWADTAAAADAFRWTTRNTTLPGVSQLAEALADRAATWRSREAIRVGLPDHFRIDYIEGGPKVRKMKTEVTDGSRRWRVFPDHVAIGPARALPEPVARMIDPSWLLDWKLTGGAEVTEGGRRGFRIRVSQRWPGKDTRQPRTVPVDVVIDAELGILLRLTQEQAGRPAMQQVLADVTALSSEDAAAFRLDVPSGTRVVHDGGGLMDESEMPAPVQTAVQLAGKAFSAAAKVGGFLDSIRKQGKDEQGGRR